MWWLAGGIYDKINTMAHCQHCGCFMPSNGRVYKRELYRGNTQRVNYGRRISYGNSNHYSVRSVCGECADAIDKEAATRKNQKAIQWLVAAILLVLYFLLK